MSSIDERARKNLSPSGILQFKFNADVNYISWRFLFCTESIPILVFLAYTHRHVDLGLFASPETIGCVCILILKPLFREKVRFTSRSAFFAVAALEMS